MPILTFYEGQSELSFLYLSTDLEPTKITSGAGELGETFEVYKFPYAYSENLFSYSYGKSLFYKDVFAKAAKEFGFNVALIKEQVDAGDTQVSRPDLQLFTIGLTEAPNLPFVTKKATTLQAVSQNPYIFINRDSVIANGYLVSSVPVEFLEQHADFYANMLIFPSIQASDSRELLLQDDLVRASLKCDALNQERLCTIPEGEVVFSGERMTLYSDYPGITILLLLDIVQCPGVYKLAADLKNVLPNALLIELFSVGISNLGTLINSPGYTEVLYKSDIGTSQLFEITPESIFIVPLDDSTAGTVVLKNNNKTKEFAVSGGEVGVIFDTRNKTKTTKFTEMYIDVIESSLSRFS